MAQEIGYLKGEVKAHNLIGISFWARDLYERAMPHYLEALRISRETGDVQSQATALVNLGSLYDELKQFAQAREMTLKGVRILEQLGDSLRISKGYMNLGVIYNSYNQYDSALICFETSLRYRTLLRDTAGIALALNNMGAVQERIGLYYAAITNLLEARSLAANGDPYILSDIYRGLGHNYLLTGESKKGVAYADSAITLAHVTGRKSVAQLAYSHLKDYYLSAGKFDSAFYFLRKEFETDTELRGSNVQKEIEVLRLKFEDAEKQKELAFLENENLKHLQARNIIVICAVALIILIFVVLNFLRMKARKDHLILQSRHELALLKQKELNAELDQKKRELTAYTLNFVQKSQMFSELKNGINNLKKELPANYNREILSLDNKIEESFRLDNDWEDFKNRFEQVHHNFFADLKEAFPDVTSSELKLCALLKLNFNLKEAAQILGIAPESVKTARYRLKKKLELKPEENLSDFLLTFDTTASKSTQ